MNPDEESILTAYLDGELEPGERHRVESALISDPRLADELHALGVVRDLVAGLSRPPVPSDLSAPVLARLKARRRRLALPALRSGAWGLRVMAVMSTAAAVLALLTAAPHRPVHVRSRLAGPPRSSPQAKAPLVTAQPSPVVVPTSIVPRQDPGLVLDTQEKKRGAEADEVRKLLDNPHLHKVFIVTDVLGGETSRRVGEMLETTPRRHAPFGRITVTQGIVFDPRHPGEATVFAVVLDDTELRQLQGRLNEAFPAAVEESEPKPELVMQLADVGRVDLLPGTPVADLIVPDAPARALRTHLAKSPAESSRIVSENRAFDPLHDLAREADVGERLAAASGNDAEPSRRRDKPAPAAPDRDRPAGRRPSPPTSVVLVWVVPGSRAIKVR